MTKVDPYDNYLVSKRKSEAEEWEVYNIAPMTLHEALTTESLLESDGYEVKIQFNGEQYSEKEVKLHKKRYNKHFSRSNN